MKKFLLKLLFVLVLIFVALKIPAVSDAWERMKVSVNEKIDNVVEEKDRVMNKVDAVKDKVDATKETVTNITNKVKETGEAIEDAFTQIDKAVETVDSILNGGGETVPEGSVVPAEEAEDPGAESAEEDQTES